MLQMGNQELRIGQPEALLEKQEVLMAPQERGMDQQNDMMSGLTYFDKMDICDNFWTRLRVRCIHQEDVALGVAYLNRRAVCDNFWSRLRSHTKRIIHSELL
jgi:hypothetical protein